LLAPYIHYESELFRRLREVATERMTVVVDGTMIGASLQAELFASDDRVEVIYYESCTKYLQLGMDFALAGLVAYPAELTERFDMLRRNSGAVLAGHNAEHTHDEDEVRFFVEGSGCFYLHLGDEIYAVVCTEGDLVSVPAGTTHWFDMGARPRFCAIRFFQEEDGWVAGFTGVPISTGMPTLDELLAPTASS